jgi:hypothetical protein
MHRQSDTGEWSCEKATTRRLSSLGRALWEWLFSCSALPRAGDMRLQPWPCQHSAWSLSLVSSSLLLSSSSTVLRCSLSSILIATLSRRILSRASNNGGSPCGPNRGGARLPCPCTCRAGSPRGPPHQLHHLNNSEATTPRRVDTIIQEAVRI